ncbi:hypothetical protein Z950_4083 [Sulfitobacter mediterraneus KCTC 32188]|nr:hypothetical protein Z950_4083 [Sulfitobacter mediterraneus KCTC 32188]
MSHQGRSSSVWRPRDARLRVMCGRCLAWQAGKVKCWVNVALDSGQKATDAAGRWIASHGANRSSWPCKTVAAPAIPRRQRRTR